MTSSPVCYRDGFKENWRGELIEYDAAAAKDVAVWRKAERQRLIAWRQGLPNDQRQANAEDVCAQLYDFIQPSYDDVISTYWPFKGEMDLRPFMRSAIEAGATIVLPVVEKRNAPLKFRRWMPNAQLERGIWGILQPVELTTFTPNIVVAPLVGFDNAGYRLGHGGGYYDRTLAEHAVQPQKIGVGWQAQRLQTIHPQPHDVPMDAVLLSSELKKHKKLG